MGGRNLKPAKRNYSAVEKKLLAVIAGIKHYHEFLQPKQFLIRTDNSAIQFLNSTKHVVGRLGRWNLVLSSYKYRVEHIKGKQNIIADRLSRIELPVDDSGCDDDMKYMSGDVHVVSDKLQEDDDHNLLDRSSYIWEISLDAPNHNDSDEPVISSTDVTDTADENKVDELLSPYNVAQLQGSCLDCRVFIDYLQDGILPRDDAGARKIVYQSEKYVLQDGLLYHLDLPRQRKRFAADTLTRQLVLPRSLRKLILSCYHDESFYIGGEKLCATIRQKYYWPHLYVQSAPKNFTPLRFFDNFSETAESL